MEGFCTDGREILMSAAKPRLAVALRQGSGLTGAGKIFIAGALKYYCHNSLLFIPAVMQVSPVFLGRCSGALLPIPAVS